MDSKNVEMKNSDMTYEEARKKLKEVETLLKHRKPLKADQIDAFDTKMGTFFAYTGSFGGFVGGIVALSTTISFLNPLCLLFLSPLLVWIPIFGASYDGNPKNKIRKLLYNLTVPKKLKAIREKQFETIREYELQEKIFKLFVEQKKQELTSLGVFDVLNQGLPESYPQMDSYGEVRELSPHQWRTLQSGNSNVSKESLADKLNMEENLRYLISENPQALKEIKA